MKSDCVVEGVDITRSLGSLMNYQTNRLGRKSTGVTHSPTPNGGNAGMNLRDTFRQCG
jgi:hypothetical protein